MNSSVKYVFGTLAAVVLFAALITFLEQITGKGDTSYVVPCFLVFVGAGLGFFAWGFNPESGIECADKDDSPDDGDEVSSASAEGRRADD